MADGDNHDRLAAIKAEYDPENVLRYSGRIPTLNTVYQLHEK
jgi:hypothetical protein